MKIKLWKNGTTQHKDTNTPQHLFINVYFTEKGKHYLVTCIHKKYFENEGITKLN